MVQTDYGARRLHNFSEHHSSFYRYFMARIEYLF